MKVGVRIKAFYGTSPNAVKTQIWAGISTYLLVAILKKRLNTELSLYTILQILSVSLFEQTPLLEAFTTDDYIPKDAGYHKQLLLID